MVDETTDGPTEEQKAAEVAKVTEAAKLAEAEKEQTVKYATYDKAMNTAAKRKEEIDSLKKQLEEATKANLENTKNTDTGKYVETLETQNELVKQQFAELQASIIQERADNKAKEIDRTKLSAVWDVGRKQGMVDDRDLLNFIDKEVIQLDENGVVNIKSVNAEINRLKTSKPYFFAEPTPERINDRAPSGDDEHENKNLSFSEQLRKQNS